MRRLLLKLRDLAVWAAVGIVTYGAIAGALHLGDLLGE